MIMERSPGILEFEGVHCRLLIKKLPNAVLLIRISGTDTGEFGDAPMHALNQWLADDGPVKLFIDARDVRGASIDVSSEWAAWLNNHKDSLIDVTMLTGSRLIRITADFVRRYAGLDGLMWICTEAAVFDLALSQAQAQIPGVVKSTA